VVAKSMCITLAIQAEIEGLPQEEARGQVWSLASRPSLGILYEVSDGNVGLPCVGKGYIYSLYRF